MGRRSIFFGLAFIALGIYEYVEGKPQETLLYMMVGGSFIITYYSYRESTKPEWKKPLTIASWVFIALAAIVFLYLLREEAWSWA